MHRYFFTLLVLVTSAFAQNEPWRPLYHFTPAKNWMNDPNGMVYFDGEWHLFYQYNPFGDKWGHMSWGHAVSRDLLKWEHLPVALPEENGIMIFSGSAVMDEKNTSGFGRNGQPPMVAIYTAHTDKNQSQALAYSHDRGRTWTKFSGNPVLDIGDKDFRDPKVIWHEATKCWIMAVAWPVPRKVRFYSSPDLKKWTHLSDFGPAGSVEGIWECPDLFPLGIEGGGEKWVLIVNVGSGAPATGSGGQYFVGDFDGTTFKPDLPPPVKADEGTVPADLEGAARTTDSAAWLDYGPDFYAGVTWSGAPGGRRVILGWMSNWQYANDVPTSPWRSTMSVPRQLSLRSSSEGLKLRQWPVQEIDSMPGTNAKFSAKSIQDNTNEANSWLNAERISGKALDLFFQMTPAESGESAVEVLADDKNATRIGINTITGTLFVDRSHSGRSDFSSRFPALIEAPLSPEAALSGFRVLVDACSVEVFADDGNTVLTALVLPPQGAEKVRIVSAGRVGSINARVLSRTAR